MAFKFQDGVDTTKTATCSAGGTTVTFNQAPTVDGAVLAKNDILVLDSDGGANGPEWRRVIHVSGVRAEVSEGFTNAHSGADAYKMTIPTYVSDADIKNQIILGADTTETGVLNQFHAGWVQKRTKTRYTEGTATAVTSNHYETLVASGAMSGDQETGGLADS